MAKLHPETDFVKAEHVGGVYNTPWFGIDGGAYLKNGSFKFFAVQLAWSNVVGTANGTIEVISTLDGMETVIAIADIDSTSNLTNVKKFNLDSLSNAIRLRITFNDITSFTFESDMEFYR